MRAIVFDLDDTLVDTFGTLITPLETEAASRMASVGSVGCDAAKVFETILRLRRDDPERVEERLSQDFPQLGEETLAARRSVFAEASPDAIRIEADVREMLSQLSGRYDTYLLTTGRTEFQNRKLELLGIRGLFKAVAILASGSEETKEGWLKSLVSSSGYNSQSVIVVGNRLDNEMLAGRRLGMKTVWVRRGEGSGLIPREELGEPDYTISHIREFPEVLSKIEAS
ncbi:MAG TPA: HAD family hydrolase [Pyrinomonadaceae bacterium]|nr:HAD family hydrolase [Pyrinomonadaceae bacterium]